MPTFAGSAQAQVTVVRFELLYNQPFSCAFPWNCHTLPPLRSILLIFASNRLLMTCSGHFSCLSPKIFYFIPSSFSPIITSNNDFQVHHICFFILEILGSKTNCVDMHFYSKPDPQLLHSAYIACLTECLGVHGNCVATQQFSFRTSFRSAIRSSGQSIQHPESCCLWPFQRIQMGMLKSEFPGPFLKW